MEKKEIRKPPNEKWRTVFSIKGERWRRVTKSGTRFLQGPSRGTTEGHGSEGTIEILHRAVAGAF